MRALERLKKRWIRWWEGTTPRRFVGTADGFWERDPMISVDQWPEARQMILDDPTWTPPPEAMEDPWRPTSTLGPV